MSQERVDLFRASIDAFNRGDVAAWLATIHPDVNFAPIRTPIEGAYRGHAGVRRFLADNRETFASFHLSYSDIRDLGDGRLLVIGTLHLRTRESGIETDVPTAAIATERDGLLIDWKDYGDPDKALEAAGLAD